MFFKEEFRRIFLNPTLDFIVSQASSFLTSPLIAHVVQYYSCGGTWDLFC